MKKEMKKESRWMEVAALVERLLEDGQLRARLRKANREELTAILEEYGFTPEDRKQIAHDVQVLYPGSAPRIPEVAVFW